MGTRRLLVGVGAVVLVGAAGAYYMQGRSQIAEARDQTAGASAQLADLQTQIAARAPAAAQGTSTGSEASPAAVAEQRRRNQHRLGCGRAGRRGWTALHWALSSPRSRGSGRPVDISHQHRGLRLRRAASLTLDGYRSWPDGRRRLARFARRRPEVRRAMGGRLAMVTQTDGSTAVQFTHGDVGDRREPRRRRSSTTEVPTMNRSRKDVAMMVAMGALLVFAVFNFVFRPQTQRAVGRPQRASQRRADASPTPTGAASAGRRIGRRLRSRGVRRRRFPTIRPWPNCSGNCRPWPTRPG